MMKQTILYTSIVILIGCAATVSHAQEPIDHTSTAIDCKLCHTDLTPTRENPQLKPCPRHSGEKVPQEHMGPDIVILDELQEIEDLYVPVRFNHKTHAHMSSTVEGCNMCHHYNEKSLTPSSCAECHPHDVIHENLAQPGLKGAYHRQCIGCHAKWDVNTDCVICHEKKAGGRLNGEATTFSEKRRYPPVKMRELIVYETEYDTGDKVPFHHGKHASQYDRNCGDCHHQQGCEACHDQKMVELKPMGGISPEEMHDHCFFCHQDADCDHCHGRSPDNVFSHVTVGWPLKQYHASLHCMDCHTKRGEFTRLNNDCASCHKDGWKSDEFNHDIVGVPLDEVHENAGCEDCHTEYLESQEELIVLKNSHVNADCSGCHDDKRSYDKEKGFTRM